MSDKTLRGKIIDEAVAGFDAGLNCSEASLLAAARYAGIENPLIPRAASAFGAGVGRLQGMCGLASGGVIALGILYGRNDEKGDKEKPYSLAKQYIAAIEKLKSTTSCREITGLDMSDPEQNAGYRQPGGVHYTVCGPLLRDCLMALFDIIDANEPVQY